MIKVLSWNKKWSKNISIRYFFLSRTLSSLGDELWAIALPITLASLSLKKETYGTLLSLSALTNLIGFLVSPNAIRKIGSLRTVLSCDILQVILFSLTIPFLFHETKILPLAIILILSSFLSAIWFSSLENYLSQIQTESSQKIHKMNFLSSQIGVVLAGLLVAALLNLGNIILIIYINIASYFSLVFSTKALSNDFNIKTESEITNLKLPWKKMIKIPFVLRSAILAGLSKTFVFNFIPFLLFLLKSKGTSSELVSFSALSFGVGNLLGAFSWKTADLKKIIPKFKIEVFLMFIFTAVILYFEKINFKYYSFAPIFSFAVGFIGARYTIFLRAFRQLVIPKNLLADTIALQSLASRLFTPISGMLFLFVLSSQVNLTTAIICLLIICLSPLFLIKNWSN